MPITLAHNSWPSFVIDKSISLAHFSEIYLRLNKTKMLFKDKFCKTDFDSSITQNRFACVPDFFLLIAECALAEIHRENEKTNEYFFQNFNFICTSKTCFEIYITHEIVYYLRLFKFMDIELLFFLKQFVDPFLDSLSN